MKKATIAALITLAVIVTVAQALITHSAETQCTIDPVPYEKLLAETLEKIIAQDWETAQKLIEIAKQAQICSPKIATQHVDLYSTLTQLNNLLQSAATIEERFSKGETEDLRDEISEVYNGLDYLRQAIHDYVLSYYMALNGYAQDKTSFYEYGRRISQDLDALKGIVSVVMERLANIYILLSEESSGTWIDLSLSFPRKIFADDDVGISFIMSLRTYGELPVNVDEARVRVSLIIGNALEVSKEVVARIGNNTTVYLHVPDVMVMYKEGIAFTKVLSSVYAAPAKVVVFADALGGKVRGFAIRSTYVYAMGPPIRFYVPPYADVNSTLAIMVDSSAVAPVNVSIFVDRVSNETLLANALIYPGTSRVNVSLVNVSVGYHTVVIVSEPSGKYVSAEWSSAVVVGTPNVPVIIKVSRVVLVPPFVISVSGEVGSGIRDYDVVVYVDNVEAYRSSISGGGFSVFLNLPVGLSTFFVGRSVVKVVVIPHASGYSHSVYVVDVVVINVLSTLLLVGVTGALYLHPKTAAVFASFLRSALLRRGGAISHGSVVVERRGFRPFRLRKYYNALIRLLSGFAEPPAPHETFREYFRRVESYLVPRVARAVAGLFTLFEIDLYSRREVDADEARKLLNAVENEIGGEVGES